MFYCYRIDRNRLIAIRPARFMATDIVEKESLSASPRTPAVSAGELAMFFARDQAFSHAVAPALCSRMPVMVLSKPFVAFGSGGLTMQATAPNSKALLISA